MKRDYWNRCDQCGRFIPLTDFYEEGATHKMLEPSSDLGNETWETLCKDHSEQNLLITLKRNEHANR